MKNVGQQTTEHAKHMKQICEQYHLYMVQVESSDGNIYDGILDGYDNDQLYLLVPAGDDDADMRQFGWGSPYGYGYPYWGYPYWGYPRRFRRFRRFGFPFLGLRGLYFPFFF